MPFRVLIPVTLNVGLMKPRKGSTRVAGEKKLRVGGFQFSLDKGDRLF